jgi:hypothetical protein
VINEIQNMRDKSFKEWVHYFITLNLFLMAVLMFFVPVYPWWFFVGLGIVSKVFVPQFINLKTSGRHASKGFRNFR